jgi:anion-transporting  ArsA/GET3 family ATPase
MNLDAFCRQSHVVVVAGKGGVGKTTVSACLARAAADAGLDVLLVALEATGALPALLGQPERFEYEEAHVAGEEGPGSAGGRLRVRVITPDDALLEYLDDHGMKRVSKRLLSSGAIDVVSTAIPGIREILVLGKVKQLERLPAADLIVIDAPAAGHAVSLLTSAGGLVDAARGGPVRAQAQDVVELITDPERCQVILVTLPEETPVNELIETAYRLEDEVGVSLGPVVVNGCYPVLDLLGADPRAAATAAGLGRELSEGELERIEAASAFRRARQELQAEQLDRLSRELPLPQLRLPFLFTAEISPAEIEQLARCLAEEVETLGPAVPGRLRGDAQAADG